MNITEQYTYPKGFFPVHISIHENTQKKEISAKDYVLHQLDVKQLIDRFILFAKEKYDLHIISNSQIIKTNQAEATIAVPFPDRENIRIDFNIFASEVEDEGGCNLYFHMESAF